MHHKDRKAMINHTVSENHKKEEPDEKKAKLADVDQNDSSSPANFKNLKGHNFVNLCSDKTSKKCFNTLLIFVNHNKFYEYDFYFKLKLIFLQRFTTLDSKIYFFLNIDNIFLLTFSHIFIIYTIVFCL